MAILAHLDDVAEGMRLSLLCRWELADRVDETLPLFVVVADAAEADREINSFAQTYPNHEIERTGDGWVTHSE